MIMGIVIAHLYSAILKEILVRGAFQRHNIGIVLHVFCVYSSSE